MYNKRLRFLSELELGKLSNVYTTKKQARQILERNKPLLAVARKVVNIFRKAIREGTGFPRFGVDDDVVGVVGCPHCTVHNCETCNWQDYPRDVDDEGVCSVATFAGYCLNDVCDWVLYSGHDEQLANSDLWDEFVHLFGVEPMQVTKENMSTFVKEFLMPCVMFLEGHIEWANVILAGGYDFKKGKKHAKSK
jgi:hypothetical protein